MGFGDFLWQKTRQNLGGFILEMVETRVWRGKNQFGIIYRINKLNFFI